MLRKHACLALQQMRASAAASVLAAVVLAALVAGSAGASAAELDHLTNVRQRLGRVHLLLQDGKKSEAASMLGDVEDLVRQWREQLQAGEGGQGSTAAEEAPPEAPAEFSMEVMHVPQRCRTKSKPGDVMRVHFIAKLLKTGKVFDSSFHTGSTPLKFVLGSDAVPESWNMGLQGMCAGEQRKLIAPPSLGPAARGSTAVPADANVEYFVELVEMTSKGGRNEL